MKSIRVLFCVGMAVLGGVALAAETTAAPTRPHKVVLVVQNHAANGAQIPMLALTDALTARLSGKGFQVINPYNVLGENENRTADGEALPKASVIELARGLGAEGAITATITDFLDMIGGSSVELHRYVVRVAFNLADAKTGAAVCGETIKVTSPQQYTDAQHNANRLEYYGDLMYSAADKCAKLLEEKAKGWNPEPPPKSPVVDSPPPKTDLGTVVLTPKRSSQDKFKPPVEVYEDFTIFDFEAMFKSLAKAMFENARFKENYLETQAEKVNRPIVIIGAVTNKSAGELVQSYGEFLSAMPDTLRMELGDYRLDGDRFFDTKDDDMSKAFAERILSSDKSPLEDAVLMDALKQHGSPDFVIVGDVRLFPGPGKKKTCRFHLTLHSLYTGKIVWEGQITAIK